MDKSLVSCFFETQCIALTRVPTPMLYHSITESLPPSLTLSALCNVLAAPFSCCHPSYRWSWRHYVLGMTVCLCVRARPFPASLPLTFIIFSFSNSAPAVIELTQLIYCDLPPVLLQLQPKVLYKCDYYYYIIITFNLDIWHAGSS